MLMLNELNVIEDEVNSPTHSMGPELATVATLRISFRKVLGACPGGGVILTQGPFV
jgi:hypothetical protein